MTDFVTRFGQWGLVAGAAEGIGAAFCEQLARRGVNVILVDVKKPEMESLAKNLEESYRIQTRCLVVDLSQESADEVLFSEMKILSCRLLIYNAAYSQVKPFLSARKDELEMYINVNTRTPLRLVHEFASWLVEENQQGGILLMSSLAGLWGTRLVASYSGTKAFNLALAEALSYEFKRYGIAVSACCAGATATPGYLGTNPRYGLIRPSVMNPLHVADEALASIGKKAVILPGLTNKLTYFFLTRILPRSIAAKLVNKTMQRTYRDKDIE